MLTLSKLWWTSDFGGDTFEVVPYPNYSAGLRVGVLGSVFSSFFFWHGGALHMGLSPLLLSFFLWGRETAVAWF